MFKRILDASRMHLLRQRRREECCKLAWNMTQVDSGQADIYAERCKCGRTHRIAQAEPGRLISEGRAAGFAKS